MKCPICDNRELELIVKRENVPVLQNILFTDQKESENIERKNIELCVCGNCSFVFNAAFEYVDYNQQYENNQNHSSIFLNHLDECKQRIWSVLNEIKGNITIIEIGCGQGDFLKSITQEISGEVRWNAFGFDPAYRSCSVEINELDYDKRCLFISEYFSWHKVEKLCFENVIIISRHVIEHIKDPINFFAALNQDNNLKKYLFLETPNFNWILENAAFEDIVYEHCSFFNPYSIQCLLEKMMFRIDNIVSVFGGQYMWIESRSVLTNLKESKYDKNEKLILEKWSNFLKQTYALGKKVCLWGAGAKGVAFLNLLDADRRYINAVVDINPLKQNHYLSGTGHIIVAPDELHSIQPDYIMIMNKNYFQEIIKYVDGLNLSKKIECVVL